MSHTNPIHTFISPYFKFNFNSIISSKSKTRKLSPSFKFLSQICVHLSFLPCYMALCLIFRLST